MFAMRVALAGVLCALSGAGTAHASSTVPVGADYVALGSSYGSGPGLLPVVDVHCMRSGADYAHRVAERYHLSLADMTCGGATTANILGARQRLSGGVSVPPQIEAVTRDARLVTITIGGNDIGYVEDLIAQSCHNAVIATAAAPLRDTAGRVCRKSAHPVQPDRAGFDALERSLVEVVTAVQRRAPAATVVLVDYLPALDSAATTCRVVPLERGEAVTARHAYDGLLTATRLAAVITGARLARVADAENDHTACGSDPWITGFELPNPKAGKGIPYHPTEAGMVALADAVEETLGG